MIEIILDKRQSTKNEFFYGALSTISKESLSELINYLNDNSNIKIEWIKGSDIADNSHFVKGIRILKKADNE
tara:strand:- start:3846 stop:4061 length:216 start_codon:yes stop_codon:yes gene_type:complete